MELTKSLLYLNQSEKSVTHYWMYSHMKLITVTNITYVHFMHSDTLTRITVKSTRWFGLCGSAISLQDIS